MKISLPGISSTPEAWTLDFINQTFNFQSNQKYPKLYRVFSYIVEALVICSILISFIIIIMGLLVLFNNFIYLSVIANNTLFLLIIFYSSILSIFLYIISKTYRYKFRTYFAEFLVNKNEIQKIKVTSIKNKNLKIYFKNYYIDCKTYEDFNQYLEKVNCYQLFNSQIWVADFIFKENPKSGYMILKYY